MDTLTHLFISEMISHPSPQVHKKENYYKSMVTIGDSPLSSLASRVYLVPLLYYSHIVHPPHTHHNLLLPLLSVERDKKSTSHLCRGVQFRLSVMVKEYFHSACRGAIFCIHLMPPSCFQGPVEKSAKMATGGGSRVLRTENYIAIKTVELEEQRSGQWVCCNLYM